MFSTIILLISVVIFTYSIFQFTRFGFVQLKFYYKTKNLDGQTPIEEFPELKKYIQRLKQKGYIIEYNHPNWEISHPIHIWMDSTKDLLKLKYLTIHYFSKAIIFLSVILWVFYPEDVALWIFLIFIFGGANFAYLNGEG